MIKQVIVMRQYYPDGKGGTKKLRRGKEIAQACHASIAFLTRKLQKNPTPEIRQVEWDWINGIFAKVCLKVDSEEELMEIYDKAVAYGCLEVHLITDRGLTEFHDIPTTTCLAIGPDESEKIDAITGHLPLY